MQSPCLRRAIKFQAWVLKHRAWNFCYLNNRTIFKIPPPSSRCKNVVCFSRVSRGSVAGRPHTNPPPKSVHFFGERLPVSRGAKNLARATPSQRIGRIFSEDWQEKRRTAIGQQGCKKKELHRRTLDNIKAEWIPCTCSSDKSESARQRMTKISTESWGGGCVAVWQCGGCFLKHIRVCARVSL